MVLSMPRPSKQKDTGVYWYRQRVPQALAEVAKGKPAVITIADQVSHLTIGAALKVSLRTKDPALAKARALDAQEQFNQVWASLGDAPVRLTNKQLVALSGEVYRAFALLEDNPGKAEMWAAVRAENADLLTATPATHPLTLSKKPLDVVDLRFGPFVDATLAKYSLVVDIQSRTELLKHTARALQEAAELLERRADGDYGPDANAQRFPLVEVQPPAKRKLVQKTTVIDDPSTLTGLLSHKQKTQTKKEATFTTYRGYLKHFTAFVGHEIAAHITKDDVRRWRDSLIERGLATKTINDQYLASLKSTLNHGIKDFNLAVNVAAGIRDERDAPAPVGSKGYSLEQAATILEATFRGTTKNLAIPYQRAIFWVPWICAYTGLRVSEVTQFRGKNLLEKDGNPYLLITPEDGSTKGGNAWTTGIHPHLIELGLLEMLQSFGDGPAFYTPYPAGTNLQTLKDHRAKSAGDKIAEWVRDEVGIAAPGNRPSHAWRHAFTTLSRTHKMDKEARDYMLGSRSQTDAREGYGDWEPKILNEEISKLPRLVVSETPWRPPRTKVSPEPLKSAKFPGRVTTRRRS